MSTSTTTNPSNVIAKPEEFRNSNTFTPRVDVWETENELFFLAEIPGVQPSDISLNFENGQLTLLGKVHPSGTSTRSILKEYGVGNFYRKFAIHEDVDGTKISADYKQGILTVRLPKREEVKPRRIEITA